MYEISCGVGGWFSVFIFVGLVLVVLVGVDVEVFLVGM